MVSDEKSAATQISLPIYNVLFLPSRLSTLSSGIIMCSMIIFWAYLVWVSLKHLELVCHQTWENFSHTFPTFFSTPISFFSSSMISLAQMLAFFFFSIVPEIPQGLCLFFQTFSTLFFRQDNFCLSIFKFTDSFMCPPHSTLESTQWIFITYCSFFQFKAWYFVLFFVVFLPLLRMSIFLFISRLFAFPAQSRVGIAALKFFTFNSNI